MTNARVLSSWAFVKPETVASVFAVEVSTVVEPVVETPSHENVVQLNVAVPELDKSITLARNIPFIEYGIEVSLFS